MLQPKKRRPDTPLAATPRPVIATVSRLTPAGATNTMKPSARELTSTDKTRLESVPKTKKENVRAVQLGSYNGYVKDPSKGFQKPGLSFDEWMNAESERGKKNARNNPEPKGSRTFWAKDNGPKSPCKGGACSK